MEVYSYKTIWFILLILVVLYGCKDSPSSSQTEDKPESIIIKPNIKEFLVIEDTLSLLDDFEILNNNGNKIDPKKVQWRLSEPSKGVINNYKLIGTKIGKNQLIASYNEIKGFASFTVNSRISSISINPDTTVTWVNESRIIKAKVFGLDGNRIKNANLQWKSLSPNIVSIETFTDSSSTVRGLSDGYGDVELTIQEDTIRSISKVQVNSTLEGNVYTIENEPLRNIRFHVKTDTNSDSIEVLSDGSFKLKLNYVAGDKNADLYFKDSKKIDKKYLPSLKKDSLIHSNKHIKAILVPRKWQIRNGEFAGITKDVSLQVIFAVGNFGGIFYREYRDNWRTKLYSLTRNPERIPLSVAYPKDKFPLSLYFHRGLSNISITKEDSIKFWDNVSDMEQRFGQNFFEPAYISELDSFKVRDRSVIIRPYSVSVRLDSTISADGLGGAISVCNTFNSICIDGYPHEDLIQGTIIIQEKQYLWDDFLGYITQHELIHALGFAHACFPSIMSDCSEENYSYQNLPLINQPDAYATEYDVAYMELYWELHDLIIKHSANFGLIESLQGERIFELGMQPIPGCFFDLDKCNSGDVGASKKSDIIGFNN